jgi:ubiquinone/menaquinone biosynthesis C-methylase UbiE
MVELDNPFTKTNRAHVIIEHLGLQRGMKVLDAGCGPGRLAIPAAEGVGPQGEVVAVDIQAGMLDRAREKARAANLTNVEFRQIGLGEGKLEQAKYDRALLVTVLGEIPKQKMVLEEVFDTLKPNGILSITEVIFDPHFQTRGAVLKVAGAAGFQERAFFGNSIAYTVHLTKPGEAWPSHMKRWPASVGSCGA